MDNTMEIPINADVFCPDGKCGHSICVIIDPKQDRISHVVVRENHASHDEILVSTHLIETASPDKIQLTCSRNELEQMQKFIEEDFVHFNKPAIVYQPNSYMAWPIESSEDITKLVKRENIPFGEMAVHKGSHVYATDGRIGQVDDFIVNPENDLITHIVMKERHLWNHCEVAIPVTSIDHIEDDMIVLKIDKASVEKLPDFNPA